MKTYFIKAIKIMFLLLDGWRIKSSSLAITILGITHRPIFCFKQCIMATGVCLRLQANLLSMAIQVELVSDDGDRLTVFGQINHVPPEDEDIIQSPKCCNLNQKTGRWLVSTPMIITLIHHRHKLTVIINIM